MTNGYLSPVAVYLRGSRVGTAETGRKSCITLRNVPEGAFRLGFKVLAHRRWQTPMQSFSVSQGWQIRLGTSPALDGITLKPAAVC